MRLTLTLLTVPTILLLSGCYMPKSLSELRSHAPDRVESYNLSYQTLAECWQNNAEPTYLDWKRSSFLNIFPEKGYALVTTDFSLFEIREMGKNKSKVLSYDGGIHEYSHNQWFDVLRECETHQKKIL